MNNRLWILATVLPAALCACTGNVANEASTQEVAADVPIAQRASNPAHQATTQTATAVTTRETGIAGSRIYLDPGTGQPRAPTAAELAAETASQRTQINATSSATRTVKVTALPNGMTEYDLGDAARVRETVCVQQDGSLGECTAQQQQQLRSTTQQPHK